MTNETLITAARNILKELLAKCTYEQQHVFKRMYGHKTMDLPIDDIVDKMDPSKMDRAISQCEATLDKRNKSMNDVVQ